MKYIKSLLLPGNEITAVEEMIQEGQIPAQDEDLPLGGPYEAVFDNGFKVKIWAINSDPPHVEAILLDDDDNVMVHNDHVDGTIDQDYVFSHSGDTYRLTVTRAANTVLTPQEHALYVERGGVRCPFCGSDDLHTSTIQTDAAIAWGRVSCCACAAEWDDQYQLTGIRVETLPAANVARQPEDD